MNNVEKITEQALSEKISDLPNEMAPERDLWAGIERAIQNKSQDIDDSTFDQGKKSYFVPATWAASIVAAVLVTWLSFSPLVETEKSNTLTAQNSEEDSVINSQLVSMIHDNFTQQKQAMLVSFGQPDLTKLSDKMQIQLSQLAQARLTIEKALMTDPNNLDLLNLLRFTQQQELNLLQQLLPHTGKKNPQWQTI